MLSISLESWLTIAAIILGPLLAVQVTRFSDARKEKSERKLSVFRTLMATRGSLLAPAHVEALNSIDLEFSGNNLSDKNIREAWKAYLAHLTDKDFPVDQWNVRRADLLVDLLSIMGKSMQYDFDKTHIKHSIYSPTAYGDMESDQNKIRQGIIEILEGTRSIPFSLDNLPPTTDTKQLINKSKK